MTIAYKTCNRSYNFSHMRENIEDNFKKYFDKLKTKNESKYCFEQLLYVILSEYNKFI